MRLCGILQITPKKRFVREYTLQCISRFIKIPARHILILVGFFLKDGLLPRTIYFYIPRYPRFTFSLITRHTSGFKQCSLKRMKNVHNFFQLHFVHRYLFCFFSKIVQICCIKIMGQTIVGYINYQTCFLIPIVKNL